MFCPNCRAKNPADARFCNQCGTHLTESMNDPTGDPDQTNVLKSDALNSTPEDVNGETEDSAVHCLVCKTGLMHPTIHSGTFGFGTRKMLICNDCGAGFEIKGQKYKFSEITDTTQPLWLRYGHQTLTESEWIRISEGGVSDEEQKQINREADELNKQEIAKQKEKDANDFLMGMENGSIPIKYTGQSPVILKKDEMISIIMENISLQEPRAVRQTHAAYAGPTIRVAKGVSFRMGGASARSESHEEIKVIDNGKLILTNKRLIFIGTKRTVNIDLRKILAIVPYKDGIESQRENKQKPEYFTGTDKHTINYTINGRSGTVPVYGNVLNAAIQGLISKLQ
ncbi:MAG: zinc ribbon domain-containing protein [Methanobacterium sp. ERen5]|nr:MAG: zinc ribbon domain-containing protein [Methanobacterium sp. ERen5]